jgi:hypothetical protein
MQARFAGSALVEHSRNSFGTNTVKKMRLFKKVEKFHFCQFLTILAFAFRFRFPLSAFAFRLRFLLALSAYAFFLPFPLSAYAFCLCFPLMLSAYDMRKA